MWSQVGVITQQGASSGEMSFVWIVNEGKFWKEEKLAGLLKKTSLFQLACLEKRKPNIPLRSSFFFFFKVFALEPSFLLNQAYLSKQTFTPFYY